MYFSYPSQLVILANFSFLRRKTLEKRCSAIKSIYSNTIKEKKPIQSMELRQRNGGFDENTQRHKSRCGGYLRVDSVEWTFKHNQEMNYIEIKCSMYPGKKVINPDKLIIRKFFNYFLKFRIEKLYLVDAVNPFEDSTSINCPVLIWDVRVAFRLSFLKPLKNHIFEKIEFLNWSKDSSVLGGRFYSKLLVIHETRRLVTAGFPTVADVVLFDALSHVTLRFTYRRRKWFLELVKQFRHVGIHRGSFRTGVFRRNETLKEKIWEMFILEFIDCKEEILFERECIIIERAADFTIALFHNLQRDGIDDRDETFTVIKIPMENDPSTFHESKQVFAHLSGRPLMW